MLPWAKALQDEHESNDHKSDPLALCMPPGVPRINTSNSGEALHPADFSGWAPAAQGSSADLARVLGGEVGGQHAGGGNHGFQWARVAGYQERPAAVVAKVTERFTRRDFGHRTSGITIDDPKAYAKPWSVNVPYTFLADSDLIETFCENEKDKEHATK